MASELRVNQITSQTGLGTVTLGSGGVSFSGTPTFNDVTLSSINGNAISGTRNRIINGSMEIDQRNAGASVTLNNSGGYTVDRWACSAEGGSGTGTATVQRVADAPVGFSSSLKYTVTNAKTPASTNAFYIYQSIEGQNIIDFAFGTASAKTVTLSFWVKCSLTGTFSGFIRTQIPAITYRSYIFNYTINSANTWEYKTVTAPGDTEAVPNLNNGLGIGILFDMGTGSTYQTSTLNTWQTGNFYRSTSSTSLISTNGATFQLTGVQLELGSVATPFERRSIGQELALCQRYFHRMNTGRFVMGYKRNDTNCAWFYQSPVPMRISPTPTLNTSGTFTNFQTNFSTTQSSPSVSEYSLNTGNGLFQVNSTWASTHTYIPSYESFDISFTSEL
jgi:hypothetical protein